MRWRRREQEPHSGVEGLSGPCRGRVPKTRQKTFLRVSATKWPWRKREVFSNVTLLGINRILVRSDNERTLLSLIEHVMSNLTVVELVQCSWNQGSWSRFARQPPEQSSSGDNALHAQRAEGVSAALEQQQPARSTRKCVLRRTAARGSAC